MRTRRILVAGGVLLGAAAVGAWVAARAIDRRLAQEVAQRAAPLGVTVREARFSWVGPFRLEGVTVDRGDGQRLTVDSVGVGWRLGGARDVRAHVRHLSLEGVHPMLDGCARCGLDGDAVDLTAFDLDEGGTLCRPCARGAGRAVTPDALDLLRRMLGGGLNGVLAEAANPATHEVEFLGIRALEHHVERRLRAHTPGTARRPRRDRTRSARRRHRPPHCRSGRSRRASDGCPRARAASRRTRM